MNPTKGEIAGGIMPGDEAGAFETAHAGPTAAQLVEAPP